MVLRMYIMISQFRRLTTLLKAGQNSGGDGGGNAIVDGGWMAEETKRHIFIWVILHAKLQISKSYITCKNNMIFVTFKALKTSMSREI